MSGIPISRDCTLVNNVVLLLVKIFIVQGPVVHNPQTQGDSVRRYLFSVTPFPGSGVGTINYYDS
jgi:hypothetical protein